jgi:hypothetical protein
MAKQGAIPVNKKICERVGTAGDLDFFLQTLELSPGTASSEVRV